jgi:branched-chain amino acid transport system permease protein
LTTVFQVTISGLVEGAPLFMIASGLTLIYGVMGILNFAQGSFCMIGAFAFAAWFTDASSLPTFILTLLLSGLLVAVIGGIAEIVVFRRLHSARHEIGLLSSFALYLALDGATSLHYGVNPVTANYPASLSGHVDISGAVVSDYGLFLIAFGAVVSVLLVFMVKGTRVGRQIRAVAEDRTMAMGIGIRSRRLALLVFVIGSFLAGIAGALIAPTTSIDTTLATSYLIPAFVVVIVGGMGSITGTLIAAVGLSLVDAIVSKYVSGLAGFSFYIVIFLTLMLRPNGLFGTYATAHGADR